MHIHIYVYQNAYTYASASIRNIRDAHSTATYAHVLLLLIRKYMLHKLHSYELGTYVGKVTYNEKVICMHFE